MKYKKYRLILHGHPEIVAFLAQHVPAEYDSLKAAKERGRAAELLFDITWEWESMTLAR